MLSLLDHPYLRPALFFLLIMGLLAGVSWIMRPLLIPLVLAFMLYAILDPWTKALIRRGLGKVQAISINLGVLIVLLIGLLILGVPAIISQVREFRGHLPQIYSRLQEFLDAIIHYVQSTTGMEIDIELVMGILPNFVGGGSQALSAATSIMAQVASAVILIPLLTFFLLRDFRALRNQLMGFLPNRSFELGWLIYTRVVKQLQGYVRGVMLQSFIMAMITGVGFALIGLDLAVLLGLLAGLLNIIPYIGPLLAMIPPVTMALSGADPQLWLIFSAIGVVALAQVIDNLVVVPSLIANAADLHPLSVLVGIVIAGFFFGFAGMIVAIPLMFTSKIIFTGLLHGISGHEVAISRSG